MATLKRRKERYANDITYRERCRQQALKRYTPRSKLSSEELASRRLRARQRTSTPDVLSKARLQNQKKQDKMNLLKIGPCSDCGLSFPPECMDFDHVRGEKVCQISRAPVGLLAQELLKCDLVCANCHRIRTRSRSQGAWRQKYLTTTQDT